MSEDQASQLFTVGMSRTLCASGVEAGLIVGAKARPWERDLEVGLARCDWERCQLPIVPTSCIHHFTLHSGRLATFRLANVHHMY